MEKQSLLALRGQAKEVFIKKNALVGLASQLLSIITIYGTGIEFWYMLIPCMFVNLAILNLKIGTTVAANLYFWTNFWIVVVLSVLYRRLSIELALLPLSCLALFIFSDRAYSLGTSFFCLITFIIYRLVESSIIFIEEPFINYTLLSMIPILVTGIMLIFEIMLFISIKEKQYSDYKKNFNGIQAELAIRDERIQTQTRLINNFLASSNELQSVNKQLEFMLAQKTRELQTYLGAIENSLVCVLFGLDHRLIQINKYTSDLYGQIGYTMIGKKINDLFFIEQTKRLFNEMIAAVTNGTQWRGDIIGLTNKNHSFYVDAIITPIKDLNNNTLYFLLLGLPFTEKKLLELQRNETMAALENIAFKTSHKIRGPMARIQGLLYLAKRNYLKQEELVKTSDELIRNITELDQATSELTNFVNNHYNLLNNNKEEKNEKDINC